MIEQPRNYSGPAVGDYFQAASLDGETGEAFVSRDGLTLDISESVRQGGITDNGATFTVEGYVLADGRPVIDPSKQAARTWRVDVEPDAESGGDLSCGAVVKVHGA